MSDEQQIRALIEAWAIAAHDGDLATVLADHAPDIVMFDVPPPNQGVRGTDAYRATRRLRLTLGLRKAGGRWIVAHEHHSFSDTAGPDATPSSNVVRS